MSGIYSLGRVMSRLRTERRSRHLPVGWKLYRARSGACLDVLISYNLLSLGRHQDLPFPACGLHSFRYQLRQWTSVASDYGEQPSPRYLHRAGRVFDCFWTQLLTVPCCKRSPALVCPRRASMQCQRPSAR